MPTPDVAIAEVLDAASLELLLHENLFTGPVREPGMNCPTNAVFCLLAGGPGPAPYMGNQRDVRRFQVQVVVRHEDFEAGQVLTEEILSTLHRTSASGYWSVRVIAEPAYLAQDDEALHEWSLNVELGWSG